MTTQTVAEGDAIRLVVEGSVNSQTAETFEKALLPLVKEGKKVVVDFAGVDHLSSAGLRVLLEASNTVAKPEDLKLIHGFFDFIERQNHPFAIVISDS